MGKFAVVKDGVVINVIERVAPEIPGSAAEVVAMSEEARHLKYQDVRELEGPEAEQLLRDAVEYLQFDPGAGRALVELEGEAGIGWSYADGEFSPP